MNGKLRTMIGEIGSRGEGEIESADFRAGFVAVIGLPNVGKSTLVNALVGQRLSIVTPKAQTTRQRLLAIYTDDRNQAVFVDTPGLLEPRYLLQQGMREEAERAAVEADIVVYVVDSGYPRSVAHAREWGGLPGVPVVLCLNKIDRVDRGILREIREEFVTHGSWDSVIETYATNGEGVEELRAAVLDRLPPGPPFYPEDDVATAPVRFFAAELVRETCLEQLGQELPYSIAIGIEEFRESDDPVYVSATIFVERDSQKGMVIGRGGVMIRSIGTASRHKLEALIERPVYLDLRVKVMPNWRRNPARLKLLGYHVPSRKA
jgi:GTP-binding protein Era